ncbi:MAG: hypothetical protein RIC55_01500 [Pirellulaceae bacterium]
MDLILILIGMSLGGMVGWGLAEAFAGSSVELRTVLSVLGAMFGAVGGYGIAWLIKSTQQPMRPVAARPRNFRPQVVGSLCAGCGERILMIVDGEVCPECQRVFCKTCVASLPCSECRSRGGPASALIVDAVIIDEGDVFTAEYADDTDAADGETSE